MSSFYAQGEGASGAQLRLLPDEARHAFQVLRLRAGEAVFVVDEAGKRFSAEIALIDKTECIVELGQQLSDNESPVRITLYQGLPKSEKLELIVQKLTELGADRIVPVKMDRCVVKLNDKDGEKKRERMQRIAFEASKQCRRTKPAEICLPATWKRLRDDMAQRQLLLVPWEDANGYGLKKAYEEYPDARDIGIVIGPEGGMSVEEVDELRAIGAKVVTLGPRILRTETAALAACTMAMTLWGDIG